MSDDHILGVVLIGCMFTVAVALIGHDLLVTYWACVP